VEATAAAAGRGRPETTRRCGAGRCCVVEQEVVLVSESASRPSKNNCQGGSHGGNAPESDRRLSDGLRHRPVSVEPDVSLREECTLELTDGVQAANVGNVLQSWRDWYESYENSHITFERDDGKTVRTALENSYMPEYGKRYYAKLKGLEREIERRYESLTTVMLTFSASHENANGGWRCPADHMRDIAAGFDTARKHLYHVLSGENWEYAKVWEPHADGYGHMHVAVFVDGDVTAGEFRPVIEKYTETVRSAGTDAHTLDKAVSVNDDIENVGSYISEYIGIFGDKPVNRPVSEQLFYSVSWATNTRRVEFSNGAQEMIRDDRNRQRREEAGVTPEDRGGDDDGGPTWTATEIVVVEDGEPRGGEPSAGGVETRRIDGRPGADPEKFVP